MLDFGPAPQLPAGLSRGKAQIWRTDFDANGDHLARKQIQSQCQDAKEIQTLDHSRGASSSAYGYAQALDGTWKEYKKSAGRWGASRTNIRDATDFMGWYMAQSRRSLGIAMSDTRNQYLAYHEGRTGYRRGSYKSKRWLVNIANGLDRRAAMYKRQLISCGKG